MSNDISTMYTKEENKRSGRRGHVEWQSKKKRNYYITFRLWKLYSSEKKER